MKVSIVLTTYNSDIRKILDSLESFIRQQEVEIEILIADDGSKVFPKCDIEHFFRKRGFTEYRIIENVQNRGTVMNLMGAVEVARGDWILSFGPGDCIVGDDCVKRWINYTVERQAEISFADIYAYSRYDDGQPYAVSVKCSPQMPYKIDNENCKKTMYQYLINGDLICGIALLTKTNVYLKYLKRIENIVKYAEDHLFRLVVLEQNKMVYYPKQTVLYEYGEGVSTSGKGDWPELLTKDKCAVDNLIRNGSTSKIRKYYERICNKRYHKWVLYVLYPRRLMYLFFVKFKPRMSKKIDNELLKQYVSK